MNNTVQKYFHLALASCLGAGYFPIASGTLASALAILPYYLLRSSVPAYLAAVLLCCALGVWSAGAAERILQEKDSHKIVIDEVAGYLITMAFLPSQWFYPVAGFFLFRLLDIWKPLWIRKSQQLPGGWGVMADDVLAGVAGNLILQATARIIPHMHFIHL